MGADFTGAHGSPEAAVVTVAGSHWSLPDCHQLPKYRVAQPLQGPADHPDNQPFFYETVFEVFSERGLSFLRC